MREVIDLARSHTELAVSRLAHWAASNEPAASVAASKELLDRAWGKSKDTVALENGGEGGVVNLPGKPLREFRRIVAPLGWKPEWGRGGHVKWKHANGAMVVTSATPGDRRALKNALAQMRRLG